MKKSSCFTLGLIPARGGSKGIRRKNTRYLSGKPLIAYSIECGLACPSIDKVVVSTDNREIAEISRDLGAEVPFMRPSELAQDETPMLQVMQHALETAENIYHKKVDTLVLLQPTSPLRKVSDIEESLLIYLQDKDCQAVISGRTAHFNPYFNMACLEEGYVQLAIPPSEDIGSRQKCPVVYDLDGTVWIYSREALMDIKKRIPPRTRLFEVPEERVIEIDTELDFKIAEILMSQDF
ncbi:MAG: acylneuraminate cytidylyltransferase family protein [Planctomycetes bacterium]|nr:acylneuraminate cytidylyltransferase family protein [Planctomycetota bacterium]